MKKLITSSSALWSCLVALAMFMASQSARAEYVKLTALSGQNAYNADSEHFDKLVDANTETKWGTWFDPGNVDWPDEDIAYIIVKADKAIVPEYYFLVTGNDTGGDPGRNWGSWKIYGGNFESDDQAVRDVENYTGWTLIDDKESEPLPAANFGIADLEFSKSSPTTAYKYFWIEITESVAGSETYLQMSEWGLGTYGDFEKYLKDLAGQATGTDEPVKFTGLLNSGGYGGEGANNLFDGNSSTKWCCGFTNRNEGATENGAYVVFKASRPMAPTYYAMTTGGDTDRWPGRNWKQWQIYGMNANNDEAVTRDAEGWVPIDKKYNVGTDQLPAAGAAQVFLSLSEGNTESFTYFKIELDEIVSGGTMQMADFLLGDQYTLALDAAALATATEEKYEPDAFAPKALLDELAQLIADIKNCTDPATLAALKVSVDAKVAEIGEGKKNYEELLVTRNQAILAIEGGKLSEEAVAYLTAWVSETDAVAPSAEFPCGNIAYIKANRQITSEEALAESKRINTYIFNNSEQDNPIYATYTLVCGTDDADNWGDSPLGNLIDGDPINTKWGTGTSKDRYIVFKASEPIKPTYYGLVTGWDTDSYKDRNWKNWKIWGANFDEEPNPDAEDFDPLAVKNSDKWVLIDVKENVGTDILKTTNLFESYIYLSIGCAEPYEYFKIEVYHSGGMQMNEFTFYNNGNMIEYRDSYVDEFADYDPRELPAYGKYISDYEDKYEELQTTVNAPDVMVFKNELVDMQKVIAESRKLYSTYDSLYTAFDNLDIESPSMSTWWDGYSTKNIAPNNVYMRGTYANIIDEDTNFGSLDDDDIVKETDYLQWIYNAVDKDNDCHYILLGGHTVGQWGDGFYGHLIDGIAKDTKDSEGNTVKATKWGGQADATGDTYIIFRTQDKTSPFFYTLTTGNDTKSYPNRNWGTWYIYGANFEGDGDATKDAEGWTLIDKKEDVGQDRLHPVNAEPSYFGFSEEQGEYMYYKVVVTKAYKDNSIQMNELYFGTPDEFEAIKDEYTLNANNFVADDYRAEQALIDDYIATVPEIDGCENMEDLFAVNYKLETLRAGIESSAALYDKLEAQAEEAKDVAEQLSASDALTKLLGYIADEAAEPNEETYPHGNAAYILEQHVLNDSIMQIEIDFLEALKVAAVAVGYGQDMDITCLIVNPTFAKAGEMLKNDKNENIGREAEGWNGYIYRTAKANNENIYAAEFCNVNKIFDVSQTLTNLKNGFYKVTLNAGYRANGDEKMLSYNYAAMAYANDIQTYVPVIREDAAENKEKAWTGATADHQIYSVDSTETYGYGIWGCEGAAHAFEQGRYAITMVVRVTDGTLTIGVKNEGSTLSGGNEWTAVGNFGLVYLGETDAADNGIAEALEEAANNNANRINVLTDYYEIASASEDNDVYATAPNFGETQKKTLTANSGNFTYEAEKLIGETMQSIYETKKAYILLHEAKGKVYEYWLNFTTNPDDLADAVYGTEDGLDEGSYDDAEAALAAKAKLYADWPDYLGIKGVGKLTCDQEDFAFEIATEGAKPYMSLTGLYEPLEKGEVILAFDYKADQDIENGLFMYETPNLLTDVKDEIPTLPAAEEWTTVYYNVTNGIKAYNFGSAVNHALRWYISYSLTEESEPLTLNARNFRFMTKAQMTAEGGKTLNFIPETGDLNGDDKVDIADAVTVLNIMAAGEYNADADLNGDQKIDIADFVTVLNIMAAQ